MKKLISTLCALAIILTLTACTNSGKTNGDANSNNGNNGNNGISSIMPDDGMPGSSTPLNTESAANNSKAQAKISYDQAKSIALKDAGLSSNEVSFLRNELDRDDGILKYEVEFTKDGVEYEYDINADSGEILWVDKDYD